MRVLVVAAHPDDETLGCGATLLRHHAAGDEVHWLIVSTRSEPRWSAEAVARRREQIALVSLAYGCKSVAQLGWPDAGLDRVPLSDLIEGIDAATAEVCPDVVYVVHRGDVHSDHVAVHTAAMSALKPFRMASLGVRRILAYETLSSTEAASPSPATAFLPTVFHDVTGFLEDKCAVLALYDTEVQDPFQPRTSSAITALARLRGATVGVEHAEAFVLLRELS